MRILIIFFIVVCFLLTGKVHAQGESHTIPDSIHVEVCPDTVSYPLRGAFSRIDVQVKDKQTGQNIFYPLLTVDDNIRLLGSKNGDYRLFAKKGKHKIYVTGWGYRECRIVLHLKRRFYYVVIFYLPRSNEIIF